MGQASILTVSANGVDTSPVVRGAWLLENILGTPPSPPPPDVEPLAPDLRGELDLHQRLARHRDVPSCNNCHRKIDPYGFVFENFNAVGMWRDRYPDTKKEVVPVADFHNGPQVRGIAEFKDFLLSAEPLVVRCLTEKLLTYASGRTLEPFDRGEVLRISAEAEAAGGRLRDLVHLVVGSEVFLTK